VHLDPAQIHEVRRRERQRPVAAAARTTPITVMVPFR